MNSAFSKYAITSFVIIITSLFSSLYSQEITLRGVSKKNNKYESRLEIIGLVTESSLTQFTNDITNKNNCKLKSSGISNNKGYLILTSKHQLNAEDIRKILHNYGCDFSLRCIITKNEVVKNEILQLSKQMGIK